MKQDIKYSRKLANVNVDQMQVFVIINKIINKGGIKINADVNVKN